MNDEPRRRRRLDDDGESGGWLSMIALIVVIALVGLLLGAVLARVFGAKTTVVVTPVPLPTIVVTQEPSLTPLPTESPSPRPTATPRATATPQSTAAPTVAPTASPAATVAPTTTAKPKPTATASPESTPSPTAKPTPKPTTKPSASPKPKPKPKPMAVATHAGPQTAADRADGVVRLYLNALAHGNTAEARSYLVQGEPTESSFMDSSAQITSIRNTLNSDGTYKVDVDLTTSGGEYYVTFAVEVLPGGATIVDHTAIKP